MFTALTAGIQPYLFWIKVIALFALVAAIAAGGYHLGSTSAHASDAKDLAAQVEKTTALQKQYDAEKLVWADTKTRMAADAQTVLANRDRQNEAELATKQSQINSLIAKNQSAIKEIQNAKQAALTINAHPVSSADPVTDGLWVDVDSTSCSGNPDGGSLVSQAAAGGHLASSQRCRLSQSTADRLVEDAATATEVVRAYNTCVGEVKVLTQPSTSQVTTTLVDTQDGKGPQPVAPIPVEEH